MREPLVDTGFAGQMLPHLRAAYNLARWLTGNQHDAEDVVQEAYLRACRFFPNFRGGDSRTWLLAIVRNTSFSWLKRNRRSSASPSYEEELHGATQQLSNTDNHVRRLEIREALQEALAQLPAEYREIIVLRELEGLSYKEITFVSGIPLGTVMSRLARARAQLRDHMALQAQGEM